jgi:PKD repeat protein
MKQYCLKKTKLMASIFAIGLSFSTLGFAADVSGLIGKNLDQNKDLVAETMKGRNYVVEVDSQGKITQLIDTGANGDGTDALPSANSAAIVTAQNSAIVDLPVNYQGQDAINFLGKNLEKVAQNTGLTPEKLKEMLQQDNTLRVDASGKLLYVDHPADPQTDVLAGNTVTASNAGTATGSTSVPIATTTALANAFTLHSKPGASKTIYLDFDGHSAQGTAWSSSTITAPAFDLTGAPSVFDNTERSNIISIWNRVAEDYIPFDVDVTTEAPTADALLRTSTADNTYGTRVVITKTVISCGCGGIAYVGVVNLVNNPSYQPAWVFQDGLGNSEKNIAEAASHEAGHTLGLLHDGQKPSTSYYLGHGSGVTGWASIMGAGYYQNVTQWSAGVYPNANNQQDDIATMASYGIMPSADDYGNTTATASSLTNIGTASAPNIQTYGVIGTLTDIDMFVINSSGGLINLTASPAATGPNLDLKLTLYNASGAIVATAAPEATLTANINQSVTAGTYYLAVTNSAHAASGTDAGFPTYGSLGQYQITGNYLTATNTAVAPVASITATSVTGLAPLAVTFSASGSVGNGNISSYQWDFGDATGTTANTATGVSAAHTFTKVGTYTVTLIVTNQYQLTNTKTLQVTVTAPPPAVTATMWESRVGMMAGISATTIQSAVTIILSDSNGKPVPNAKVEGAFSGSVTGAVTGTTDANGTIVQSITGTGYTGRSITYTLKNVTATGYVYDPTKNAKTVITLSW